RGFLLARPFHGSSGPPVGPLTGPPAQCSYTRDFVFDVGGFPADLRAGEGTVVNVEPSYYSRALSDQEPGALRSGEASKNKDQALAHFPSGQFNANSALDRDRPPSRTNLLRWTTVIGLLGETVRTACQWTLRLPARWPWQHDFIRALALL